MAVFNSYVKLPEGIIPIFLTSEVMIGLRDCLLDLLDLWVSPRTEIQRNTQYVHIIVIHVYVYVYVYIYIHIHIYIHM